MSTIEKSRSEAPPQTTDYGSIISCSLDPERIQDYPTRFEVTPPPIESLDKEGDWWQAMEDLGPAPGTKLFGFPKWVQHTEYPGCSHCGVQMRLLVTISSNEVGHANDKTRWIPIEERDALQGAPYTVRHQYEEPHDLMIGDGGDAYLFCRDCGEFTSRVQSS